MKTVEVITIWPDCDLQIKDAIAAMTQSWAPYSAKSRNHSIFSLLREKVDPAWLDLCRRTPALSYIELGQAWEQYQDGRVRRSKAPYEEAAVIREGYAFSVIAHRLGFSELDWFIKAIARNATEHHKDFDLAPTLDTLRELAIACRAKKPKRESGRKVKLLRDNSTCQFCNEPTELAAFLADARWREEDAEDPTRISRLSTLYCVAHRSKKAFSKVVEADYLRAKRNQGAVEKEFMRLESQSWGGTQATHAKSGSTLVDDFIWLLSVHRCLTYEQQPLDSLDSLETRLRWEARMMVYWRITDRKKEMIALLCKGFNQAEVARQLGLKSRQAISKALQSINTDYRLDLFHPLPTR